MCWVGLGYCQIQIGGFSKLLLWELGIHQISRQPLYGEKTQNWDRLSQMFLSPMKDYGDLDASTWDCQFKVYMSDFFLSHTGLYIE